MRIRWSTEAAEDVEEIHRYICQDSPASATRVVKKLWDTCMTLSRHPHLGRESTWLGVRKLAVAGLPYKIYYEIRRDEVWLLGIRHTSREPIH
jgi:plasmid stabilization system protein ParE